MSDDRKELDTAAVYADDRAAMFTKDAESIEARGVKASYLRNAAAIYTTLAAAARAHGDAEKDGARDDLWRHVKTGVLYRVIGTGQMEADPTKRIVVYMADDGHRNYLWVRDYDEFHDGRFVRAALSHTPKEGA